nr:MULTISPECIES: tetratricopeptide repeat protein [unclassified Nostoc]
MIQALALWRKLLGEEHPDVAQSLNNLALLYDSQARISHKDLNDSPKRLCQLDLR